MICPYCKEEIQDGATKCKHCGSLIIKSGGGGTAQSISIKQLLFSFHGRITRSTYWLKFSLPYFIIYLLVSFLDGIMFGSFESGANAGLLSGIFVLIALWPSLAVAVKRAHDRNRSGWFILLMFIPLVNIWPLIELGFLKGTDSENKYGSDPLEG